MQECHAQFRDSHMAKRKKETADKVGAAKVGTQHAVVQDDDEDLKSVASINLEANGMPSRANLLKLLGHQGMNFASNTPSDDGYVNIINRIGLLNQGLVKLKPACLKLCDWKFYLDSCATYHSVFATWCLKNIHEVEV